MDRTIFNIARLAILFFAFIELLFATKWGIGLTPDSVGYIQGARSIVKNFDFNAIGTHYPPFYFILLALITTFFSHDVLFAARWLHIIIFIFNTFFFGHMIEEKTKNHLFCLIGMILFVTANSIFFIHTMALSEPIFLSFTLLNFYFTSKFLDSQIYRHFILASLFGAFAFLTRYIGLALIISQIAVLILLPRQTYKTRLKQVVIFAFLSGLPMCLWIFYKNLLTPNESNIRSFIPHIISKAQIGEGIRTIASYFFLPSEYAYLLIFIFSFMIWLYWEGIYTEKTKSHNANKLLKIVFTYSLTYILFLVVSISFFDAHTPLDLRILSPVYVCLSLIVLISVYFFSIKEKWMKYNICTYTLLILFLLFHCHTFSMILPYYIENGIGFSGRVWVFSKTLESVKELPQKSIIFSNAPDVLTILLDRQSFEFPRWIDPVTRIQNTNFRDELSDMLMKIKREQGYLIYFNNITWRWYLPSAKNLSDLLQDTFSVNQMEDGIIFKPL